MLQSVHAYNIINLLFYIYRLNTQFFKTIVTMLNFYLNYSMISNL